MEGKIAQALSAYDLHLEGMVPLKKGYRISTDKGLFRLKEFPGSLQEFRFVNQLLIHLNTSDFRDVRLPVLTRENKNHVLIGDSIFYLSPWVNGTNIDVENLNELKELTGQLARLHSAMESYVPLRDLSDVRIDNDDLAILSEGLNELYEFAEKDDEFAENYLPLLEAELESAEQVFANLQGEGDLAYRHGDFHAGNVVCNNANRLVVLDFDEASVGNPLWDLAEILRLYGNWDVEWLIAMLSSYHQFRPLNEGDLGYLLALLSFPWDLWEIGRAYYLQGRMQERKLASETDLFAKRKLCLKVLSNISPEQLAGEGEPLRIPFEEIESPFVETESPSEEFEEPVQKKKKEKLVWRFPS